MCVLALVSIGGGFGSSARAKQVSLSSMETGSILDLSSKVSLCEYSNPNIGFKPGACVRIIGR
ncbi:hypothetical protein EON65_14100 [archaeon]|nr:MAG: hypothetical protein EON65_14100 [archaeon]